MSSMSSIDSHEVQITRTDDASSPGSDTKRRKKKKRACARYHRDMNRMSVAWVESDRTVQTRGVKPRFYQQTLSSCTESLPTRLES
jgi:hypothetical protein